MYMEERSTENHCGYLIILDLAKSPIVNMVLNFRSNLDHCLDRLDHGIFSRLRCHDLLQKNR